MDRLAAAGIEAREEDGEVTIKVADVQKIFAAVDEAEALLVELAALPRCKDEEGNPEAYCSARYAPALAGRVADLLRTCGGQRQKPEILRLGAEKRRSFSAWVSKGGQPT